jgi:hypothetical protein
MVTSSKKSWSAYECYRLGIYDRPSCVTMENTSHRRAESTATMKPTNTKP